MAYTLHISEYLSEAFILYVVPPGSPCRGSKVVDEYLKNRKILKQSLHGLGIFHKLIWTLKQKASMVKNLESINPTKLCFFGIPILLLSLNVYYIWKKSIYYKMAYLNSKNISWVNEEKSLVGLASAVVARLQQVKNSCLVTYG